MRRPLRLASLDGRFRLSAPRLPAPLHLAVAVLGARGLSWSDRLGMLRLMRGLKAMSRRRRANGPCCSCCATTRNPTP